MSSEGQSVDHKSLKLVTGKTARWDELAKDCVAFANAQGGRLLLGVEDRETEPPPGQTVPRDLVEKVQKRISELTVNVVVAATIQTAASGGRCDRPLDGSAADAEYRPAKWAHQRHALFH